MNTPETPITVYQGLANVTKALSYITKESSTGVNYKFRSIDAVMNHLHGPLADNGLFLSVRVLDDWQLNPIPGTNNRTQYQAAFRVCVDVYAADGSMVTLGPGLAQSHDYGDKSVYQAQQNAIKYLLLEAFTIPTDEPDMDSRMADESEQPAYERAAPTLEARNAAGNVTARTFDESTPAGWLAARAATLTAWDEHTRRGAATEAMRMLAIENPMSQSDVERVWGHMVNVYERAQAPFTDTQPELGSTE